MLNFFYKLITFYFLIFFSISSSTNELDCSTAIENPYVHDYISPREFKDHIIVLDMANMMSKSPKFDFETATSILSLGEGGSDFIFSLIQKSINNGEPLSHHAVDIAFADPGPPLKQNANAIIEFPENYHSQYFQNLDIKDSNGDRIFFDEIISSFSFSFVMLQMLRRGLKEEAKSMFLKVLDHLKPGGVFRLWRGGAHKSTIELNALFLELINEGKIHDYELELELSDPLLHPFVIIYSWMQKPKS